MSWKIRVGHSAISTALNNAITQGRNGKGCVLVAATGNDNEEFIEFPASNTNTIAVGATSMCEERKNPSSCDGEDWGSNYGQQLDVVAPGVKIATTDITGTEGFSGWSQWPEESKIDDEYIYFNGTSSATPHVAGIAGLILSFNSELTQAQVREIIESTTDKIGDYSYTTTQGKPHGTWNNQMGYGRVNAYKAVKAVYPYITGSFLVCTSNSTFTLHNPPGDTVSWTKGPYLSYVSGQGTDNYTVKASSSSVWGSSWVKATITTDCDTVEIQKNIYVGYTEIGDLVFTNDLGEEDFLCSDREGNLVEFSSSTSCNYFDIWLLNEYGTQVLYKLKTYTTEGSLDFSWISPGYYLVQVRGINDCGTGQWNGSEVEYVDCWDMEEEGNMYYLKFVPNPAYNSVEISVFEDENLTTLKTNNEFYQMQIYNSMKVLKYQVLSKEPILRINTANFENGLYFVHFIFGKEAQVLQLVISH